MDVPAPTDERFRCPGCDEEVDVSAAAEGQLVRCPYCSTDFFAAPGQADWAVVDDTQPAEGEVRGKDDEINAVRVRQLSALRRGAIRTRSWWLITLLMALLTALDLFAKAALYVWDLHRWGVRPTAFVVGGGAAVAVAVLAYRQARALAREAAASVLIDPTTPPDFSTLDNGADRWRRLEDVR